MSFDPKLLAAALKKRRQEALRLCFDPGDLESRPNTRQMEIFRDIDKIPIRYVVAGNQAGKSALVARELAWILNDNHPFWERPKRWGDGPLLILIVGQTRTNMDVSLWQQKLLPFLDASKWKEIRDKGLLGATNTETGDRIVFIPHGDASDVTIQNMQGYVAHYVWLDEMPRRSKILTELIQRVTAFRGYLLSSFTPTAVSPEVRRIIDACDGVHNKKYQMSKLDNPKYAKDKERLLAEMAGMSKAERETRLYGAWSVPETTVYNYDSTVQAVTLPGDYNRQWPHVESVDPALSSKTGYSLWARQPVTHKWYCVKAEYIEGEKNKDPNLLCKEVWEKSQGYNVVRRISDVHPAFTSLMYANYQYTYINPYKKTQRKPELIRGLQKALSDGTILITFDNELLIEELASCRWSESTEERIVNSQHFHIIDSAQYFVDMRPKDQSIEEKLQTHKTRDQLLYEQWQKERTAKHMKQTMQSKRRSKIRRTR